MCLCKKYFIYNAYGIALAKGSLVRKLASDGRLLWAAFPPSCQPHHHQVVGKCNRSGTHEFKLEKILGRETLRFFQGKWLPWSPK